MNRIAVLGAGTMGSRIAALFAAAEIPVLLLDLDEELARLGILRAEAGPLVTPGSFSRDLPLLRGCDWIVEAVAEDLAVKRALWAQAAAHRAPHALASTNTSGISLAAIGEGLPLEFRAHFLGVHFFNPPSKLHLVELIRGRDTLPSAAAQAARFVTGRLGKGVVEAKDTPNFIANRIGAFFSGTVMALTAEGNYTIEEADLLTGPLIGLPTTASYRLLDVIGLDVWAHVLRNLEGTEPCFTPPGFFREMLSRGLLGNKSGSGFYKKIVSGETKIFHTLDLNTFHYRPAIIPLNPASEIENLPNRIASILQSGGRAAQFLHPLLTATIRYCHRMAPEIADRPEDLDRAMRWGYGWTLGPFELERAIPL
ncbi:MAG: 3-hydroxyacyl-CoA dehydrogenase family protein [Acidobacteriota bacterium]|nr:3-hydroxyacyl-CoA dehydrogenase family protein [Acidobacteriota bacterium]